MRIKLHEGPLAVEQKNYSTKIINVYILYGLEFWLKIRLRNFTLKNCLFGVTNIIKNSDKEKCVYSDYGIPFDGKDLTMTMLETL